MGAGHARDARAHDGDLLPRPARTLGLAPRRFENGEIVQGAGRRLKAEVPENLEPIEGKRPVPFPRGHVGLDAVALGDEALQRADGDRRVDLAPAAGRLARRRTDAAADRREGIRPAGDDVGPLQVTLGDGRDVAARVRMDGASVLAADGLPPVIQPRERYAKAAALIQRPRFDGVSSYFAKVRI